MEAAHGRLSQEQPGIPPNSSDVRGNRADRTFYTRLASELGSDRRATDFQRDLEGPWATIDEWVYNQRQDPDSEFLVIRQLMLGIADIR